MINLDFVSHFGSWRMQIKLPVCRHSPDRRNPAAKLEANESFETGTKILDSKAMR